MASPMAHQLRALARSLSNQQDKRIVTTGDTEIMGKIR